jgi:hypothetical protein
LSGGTATHCAWHQHRRDLLLCQRSLVESVTAYCPFAEKGRRLSAPFAVRVTTHLSAHTSHAIGSIRCFAVLECAFDGFADNPCSAGAMTLEWTSVPPRYQWKYQLVILSARNHSIGCLRSISSERYPACDRLGGVAFRAANPPEGSMRERRRMSWRLVRYDLVAEAGWALLRPAYWPLR